MALAMMGPCLGSCCLYFTLSVFGLPLRWRGERDLQQFYGAMANGDIAKAERATGAASRGSITTWLERQSSIHGRPSGISVVYAKTDAEFGEYGTILYLMRFRDDAAEYSSVFVRRSQPLGLPPLTVEQQVRLCHSKNQDAGEITFGTFTSSDSWQGNYTIKSNTGRAQSYRASQAGARFTTDLIEPDGQRRLVSC